MPLHPQVRTIMDQMTAAGPPLHHLSPAEARKAVLAMRATQGELEHVAKVEDLSFRGPATELPLRIYTPDGRGPFPVLVYFHGGGWVVGNIETVDASCRSLANLAGCMVVSADYRLAPEHKFPAAADDCYAATRWVALHAASFYGDPARLAVGGESAGANLAAVAALMAQERGAPSLVHQLLAYPVLNCAFDTPSYRENGNGYFLTKDMMVWFWRQYLRDETDGENPSASPLRSQYLRGVASATILAAEFDPLRDEAEAYAARLREAGVPVTYTCYQGLIHGFFGMAKVVEPAKKALEDAAAALRAAFAR